MVGDWWHRRRERRAKQEARRRQLQLEYQEKLGSRDSDVLESSRDFGDNDVTPWRTEVSLALVGVGILALLVCVGLLIGVFSVVQNLTGG